MKPRIKLAETELPGGAMALYEHDGAYSISINGQELMHGRGNASERLLGKLGVEAEANGRVERILIGGLGLGYTLRSVLEAVGGAVRVEVVELIAAVVAWNRTHLRDLNGVLLDDVRVKVRCEDVVAVIRNAPRESWDVILMDIDNGPVAMVAEANASLYSHSGIRAIRAALSPHGRAVFWSAGPDNPFEARLKRAGFRVEVVTAKSRSGSRQGGYRLYVADRV